jgi:colanic acid biosynthesis glycosyl transferase WcaI
MRALVHDYSGHPFQVQLSRELARRGHEVTHSWCEAHVSGKGHLRAEPGERLSFEPIGVGERINKLSFLSRLIKELRYGVQLVRQADRIRPDVVLIGNVPIPMLVVFAFCMWVLRVPWVHWQQDVQAVAVRSFAGKQLSKAFVVAAKLMEVAERWCTRRARHTVVIADSFVDVHRQWGTAEKVSVIPNWAPLDEIFPVERKNDWAVEQEVDDKLTLLYSGTLGLKHNPVLLVELVREVIDAGRDVELVVVTEGPAVELLRAEAERTGVPLRLLPFQPYERLPEVLGSGDVLVVLLEQNAGAFSVPSKTLSYLCAGRPIVGLMPSENLAAELVSRVGGHVEAPASASVPRTAEWVVELLGDAERRADLGRAARVLAEAEFALPACATRFEQILRTAAGLALVMGPAEEFGTEPVGEPVFVGDLAAAQR